MSFNKGMTTSKTDEWETPQELFDRLNRVFYFTLDPASSHDNAQCPKHFTVVENGLEQSWSGERVFLNPPYGREIVQWVAKARSEAEQGALVVGLLPARTDARWWQEHVQGHADIRFIQGRLRFGGEKNGSGAAPFPSALAVWWGWPVLAGGFAL